MVFKSRPLDESLPRFSPTNSEKINSKMLPATPQKIKIKNVNFD